MNLINRVGDLKKEGGDMNSSNNNDEAFSISELRARMIEFLINSSLVNNYETKNSNSELRLSPLVKYTALSLFSDRFFSSLFRKTRLSLEDLGNWLLQPLKESNLQLFALISLWISSKLHDTCPLSVKSLKSLGDEVIVDQHFTTRDFVEAVLGFSIGASYIAFIFLEELLFQFRELAKMGDILKFDVCMDIMDLLYESEEMSMLYAYPRSVAASVLVAAYVLTVPKQQWEFPLLPWVRFVTAYEEEDIGKQVKGILQHVVRPQKKQCIRYFFTLRIQGVASCH